MGQQQLPLSQHLTHPNNDSVTIMNDHATLPLLHLEPWLGGGCLSGVLVYCRGVDDQV